MPDIDLTSLWPGGEEEVLAPTSPHVLTAAETAAVRQAVRAAFPEEWQVTFLGSHAGRTEQGAVAVCGIVTAAQDGASSSYPFRVVSVSPNAGPNPEFRLRQLGRDRNERLGVYVDCNTLGLV
ncbi:hypothetical protein [Aurantimonas sp. VKM B-3413]|uniref:hypothetical protein n=1 Tax=Aurantimonas sp. VKM B-3413 TaxID=2779401 RepID=UPI001E34C020|nr:hypothetical protein [Aurantimonas sp. VKM B-3413]MCB8837587.1 hypothetical protein [Aurantimonas sp. VKM B-3413]